MSVNGDVVYGSQGPLKALLRGVSAVRVDGQSACAREKCFASVNRDPINKVAIQKGHLLLCCDAEVEAANLLSAGRHREEEPLGMQSGLERPRTRPW